MTRRLRTLSSGHGVGVCRKTKEAHFLLQHTGGCRHQRQKQLTMQDDVEGLSFTKRMEDSLVLVVSSRFLSCFTLDCCTSHPLCVSIYIYVCVCVAWLLNCHCWDCTTVACCTCCCAFHSGQVERRWSQWRHSLSWSHNPFHRCRGIWWAASPPHCFCQCTCSALIVAVVVATAAWGWSSQVLELCK